MQREASFLWRTAIVCAFLSLALLARADVSLVTLSASTSNCYSVSDVTSDPWRKYRIERLRGGGILTAIALFFPSPVPFPASSGPANLTEALAAVDTFYAATTPSKSLTQLLQCEGWCVVCSLAFAIYC